MTVKNRKLWLDTRDVPVITTTKNGEANAIRWGWTEAKAVAADALEAATRVPVQGEPNVCLDHKPVQHRDGKPPWCNACGRASVPDAASEAIERVRALLDRVEKAEQALQRVREQHRKRRSFVDDWDTCVCGYDSWPCPTIRALEGDE